jgi:hypothetical protein
MTDPGRWFGRSWELLRSRLARPVDGAMPRLVAIRLATLLHDVGKSETRTVEPSGRILFWGHTEVGGTLAALICRRLRCSGDATSLIRRVAEQHLALGFLRHEDPPSSRDEVRYLWDTAPWEPEVIMVSVADRLATLGPLTDEAAVAGHVGLARTLMDRWRRRTQAGVSSPPVDGHDLMEALELGPGPLLGEVLREVRLVWESGEVVDADGVLAAGAAYLEGLRRERG